MLQLRPVEEVMTRDVVTVAPDTCWKDVLRALEERRIDAAPVVDEHGRVLGVVSESDLTALGESPGTWRDWLAHGRDMARTARKARARTAEALMSSPPRTVGPGTPMSDAARLMHRHGVGRLVVVDDDGRLAGIVTRSDLLRSFLCADADLRRRVEEAVRACGDDLAGVEVDVTDGVVTLRGDVERVSRSMALLEAVAAVPGVVDVRDEVSCCVDDTPAYEMSVRGPFA